MELYEYMTAKRQLVDARLRHILDQERECPPSLLEAMRYSLLAPGKRLRPMLVIMAAEACGGSDDDALPAACAVEMIHTYSLIHDDLPAMDDDDLRRGLPTCHKKFGEAMAILAGDGLLTLAFQVLAQNYRPAVAAQCCFELARGAGVAGMVGGQVEDLVWEGRIRQEPRPEHNLAALEHIHVLKTGALFLACLRLGFISALESRPGDPDSRALQALDAYGRRFGLIFQITDDLIDVEGKAEDTGKRVQKDAARGKLTYPGLLGVTESRQRATDLADEAIASLQPFGERGKQLIALMKFVVERDR